MKITGKDYIEIIGAEGTKHPMYIKGKGSNGIVYLTDAKTSGYVRRKVGNAWIYMHKDDVAIQKASQQTESPTTRLKKQNAELQKQVAQFQKDEAKRVSDEEKKKTRAAQNKLINRINRNGKPTPAEAIAALQAEIAALREGNEMLSEINEKLEAEIAVAGNSARTSKEDSDYRTWYEDELAAENEILRGQNEALRNAANTTSKKGEALLNPTVEEFFGGLEGDEDFTIREDVQGDSKRTVLTAKTKSDRSK